MKSKKSVSLRRCEIVSNLKDEDGNILFDIENLENILRERDCITEYCFIIHDKDTYSESEHKLRPECEVGAKKPAHIHLLLRFNAPQHPEFIGKWFGIEGNFVSKIKGNWKSAVAYQIHRNAPDKYQYSLDEITSNFDVQSIIDSSNHKEYLEKVIEAILNGEIDEYNKTLLIDHRTLVRNAKDIKEAFKVRAEHLEVTQQERQTECIFIYGESQRGKTTLAKKIAESLGFSYFVSSSANDLLYNYRQQPCILLDDVRGNNTNFNHTDWLKLLDNNTASSARSRYTNKYILCKLIIITSSIDIDEFCKEIFKGTDESTIQFKRRCGTLIRVEQDKIFLSQWDPFTRSYSKEIEYVNSVLDKFKPTGEKTMEDIEKQGAKFLSFLDKADV